MGSRRVEFISVDFPYLLGVVTCWPTFCVLKSFVELARRHISRTTKCNWYQTIRDITTVWCLSAPSCEDLPNSLILIMFWWKCFEFAKFKVYIIVNMIAAHCNAVQHNPLLRTTQQLTEDWIWAIKSHETAKNQTVTERKQITTNLCANFVIYHVINLMNSGCLHLMDVDGYGDYIA